MAKTAYFDCISGISGDMTLGALVDLGVDVRAIEAAVQSMGLPDLKIEAETVKKCGFRAIKVSISHPPEHAHRHLHHIDEMIEGATDLPQTAKELAHKIFLEVAEAEAKVHGSTLQKVHFHEVGAIDPSPTSELQLRTPWYSESDCLTGTHRPQQHQNRPRNRLDSSSRNSRNSEGCTHCSE